MLSSYKLNIAQVLLHCCPQSLATLSWACWDQSIATDRCVYFVRATVYYVRAAATVAVTWDVS